MRNKTKIDKKVQSNQGSRDSEEIRGDFMEETRNKATYQQNTKDGIQKCKKRRSQGRWLRITLTKLVKESYDRITI